MHSHRPLWFLLFIGLALPAFSTPIPINSFKKDPLGVTFQASPGLLRIEPVGASTFHIRYTPAARFPINPLFAVEKQPAPAPFTVKPDSSGYFVKTSAARVHIDKASGALSFLDAAGRHYLDEPSAGAKSITSGTVAGLATNTIDQQFVLDPNEALYGLGQHPGGVMNWVGHKVHLEQRNMDIAIPVMVSTKNYGVFWNNPAVTNVAVSNSSDPSPTIAFSSEAGTALDYYIFHGENIAQVIAHYRELTGSAPMFGRWAWGFWQCKQRYHSQQELLDTVARYRQMRVPIDGIIQDWQYWTPSPWGSHEFDPIRYPDPVAMIKQLHAENIHLLISVWPKFAAGSSNEKELNAAGYLYPHVIKDVFPVGTSQWYDPLNPGARRMYWRQISRELFAKGIDGWWLDASEPELTGHWGEFRTYNTGSGPGPLVFNAFPLMHTTAVYKGQRRENNSKRVFILTRSAYAGQQRNAAVSWSGDVRGTWDIYRQQIANGINFSMSGVPYWNTDTGGFFSPYLPNADFTELFTRWFQFSSFCPMFRVHGDAGGDGNKLGREMWHFPPATTDILITYDNLRYHLLPYIYSVSWQVTHANDTMLRGLAMDFPNDPAVYSIPDQYLFGPGIMVCPVTSPGATTRKVYLPAGATWIDFWTGDSIPGGQSLDAAAPLQTMPLYVRAGAIIPYGPSVQSSADKPDPIELRVYPGADGAFTLYDDEGDNYNYEKGAYSTIPFHWDDKKSILTIGARSGVYPGMLKSRRFHIVRVKSAHGAGLDTIPNPDKTVTYTGSRVAISL
jgi:alpha-D-xyloside xylohydrolase